jgi:hypothetical protein
LENPPRILQEQFARRADLHAPAEAVEELEADLAFQILDLPRQGGLRDPQPLCGTPEVLVFADGHEVAKMASFHICEVDTLSRLI